MSGLLSWQIGAVRVTRVVETEMLFSYRGPFGLLREARPEALAAMPWLYPNFVTDDGQLRMSIHALLVEAPGLRLVVDTCIGNDRVRGILSGKAQSTSFLADLEAAGWPRDSVDAVVCTHLHVDHVGWNTMLDNDRWVPTFPNARYLIGKAEYAYWTAEAEGEAETIMGDSVKPVFDAGLAELVEMDHVLSSEIRLIPTIGHTPGHVSVVIASEGEKAIITGDCLHHPCQIAHPDWSPPFDVDRAASEATRRKLVEDLADQPILIIGTHFAAPTAGHIVRDGESWRLDA